jgi:hypothetical protein
MEQAMHFLNKVRRHSYSLFIYIFIHKADKRSFQRAYLSMRARYIRNKDTYAFADYIMPKWNENMKAMEEYFLKEFSFSFLNHNSIKYTMFPNTSGRWKTLQKALIKRRQAVVERS